MTDVDELHAEWMRDPEYREACERLAPEFEIVGALVKARAHAGLTQAELAERMGTTPAAVARLEGGRANPSTGTLRKVARATGTRLRVAFEPA